MACTCGSSVVTLTSGVTKSGHRLVVAFALGVAALAVASAAGASVAPKLALTFAAFVVFEFCVGLYFPSVGSLKSELVPERVRATMYNIYRVPLNAIVVALLLTNLSFVKVFELCAVLQAVALVCLSSVMYMTKMASKGSLPGAEAKVA